MKKKLILILTSVFLSIGVIAFALSKGNDEAYYVKAKDEPYALNLTNLSSGNKTLTTSNGNPIEFNSIYSGKHFGSGYYIRNTTPISGIESLSISFKPYSSGDLTISYGWFSGNYYSTDGIVNSSNNTYYFDNQGPSYFEIKNKNSDVYVVDIEITYSCSESDVPDVKYTLESDGLSYRASKYNSSLQNANILSEYKGKPVTSIAYDAFGGCSSLTSIVIPNSVTSIGSGAFRSCTSLTSVYIPDSVTSIGYHAFGDCSSLTQINVSDSNESFASIGGVLFSNDQKEILLFPAGYIGEYQIPNSVTSIGEDAFYSCSKLTSIVIPNSVTSIGASAFQNCSSLTSAIIGGGVTIIDAGAFENCYSLTSVNIPRLVTVIGGGAFHRCSLLESIYIPSSVELICYEAFSGCSSLTIYCEVESQPSEWDSDWNDSGCPVVWDYMNH